jgi:hypothetical protein
MAHLIPWLQIDPELAAFSQQAKNVDRYDLCSTEGKKAADSAHPEV